ncbi:MAG: polysaccharide pyruvyl transferase family protein [Blautia sp.]
MRILVLGVYYSANLGDGVLCECTAARLKKHFPDAEIVIKDIMDRSEFKVLEAAAYSELKRRTQKGKLRRMATWIGWDKILVHEKYRLNQCLPHIEDVCEEEYDIAVVAGGQLFMDRYFLFLDAYICRLSKKGIPVYLNACGTGPAYSKIIRRSFADTLTNPFVRLISCRDDAALVQRLYTNGNKKAEETFDSALWCADVYGIEKDKNADVTGLGMMYTNSIDSDKAAGFWVRLIRQFEKEGRAWKIFVNGSQDDMTFVRYVLSQLPEFGGPLEQYCMPAPKYPQELVSLIGGFKSIISFRLHSHIIAAALDVPSIALVWDQKLRFYFEKIGHGERCLTIKQNPKEILFRLERAEKEGYDRSLIEEQKLYADNLLYRAIYKDIK